MIKIYGTENSRAMRPIWTAEEMGLDYELIMMPFPPRVFMKEYLDINISGNKQTALRYAAPITVSLVKT